MMNLTKNNLKEVIYMEKTYENKNRKCECFKCELKHAEKPCPYHDKFQRLPREAGGLGLCKKLEENRKGGE